MEAEKLHGTVVPKVMDPLFLSRVLVRDYLTCLQANSFDIFHESQHRAKPLLWQSKVLWSHYVTPRPFSAPSPSSTDCCH